MVKVNYYHNNSGGSWWLEDKDWFALEKAGWKVNWYKKDPNPQTDKDGRFLGALASSASKEFSSVEAAEEEFSEITGQDPNDEGCSCCGRPHYFSRE